jgi:hypothetical protein
MSILASLGSDAEPIRDVYLSRLQALTEVCAPWRSKTFIANTSNTLCLIWKLDLFIPTADIVTILICSSSVCIHSSDDSVN